MNYYDVLLAKKLNGGGGGGEAVLINRNISANGTYNASTDNADGYKKVVVNVPNTPTGTISITHNGTYGVTNYATAVVNVPNPSTGTISITTNGTYDVTNYASAYANIPSPSGTRVITENGTYDVTNYASADVSVSGISATDIIEKTNFPADVVYEGSTGFKAECTFASSNIETFTATKNIGLNYRTFYNCTSLRSVSMPLSSPASNDQDVFRGCTSLTSVNLPKMRYLGNNTFYGCTSLTMLVLPAWEWLRVSFAESSGLQTIDLKNGNTIENSAFKNTSLNLMILRRSSAVSLNNVGAFAGTPFASGGAGGVIYVPSSLISTYQSATNWSTINGYGTITWKAIENSQYENYYADGTPIS